MAKKYSSKKRSEKIAIATLETLLSSTPLLTQLTAGDDDFPDIDGYVHLLTEKEETTGHMVKIQVKALKKNKDDSFSITCDSDLLEHAYTSSVPVLLIAVDSENQNAYWIYLSPESVKGLLEEMTVKGVRSHTFRAIKHNVIKKGSDSHIQEWKRICLHHRNASNDKILGRYKKRIRGAFFGSDSAVQERLKTLQDLVFYRTTNGEYPLTELVFDMQRSFPNMSKAVKVEYAELIGRLIYTKTNESLEVLGKIISDENAHVRARGIEILTNAAKYDIHILNAIGYTPHRLIVDFLKSSSVPLATVREILKNILNPDYEGTSQRDPQTFTIHRGPLSVTLYLQQIRMDAIQILLNKYKSEENVAERVKIIQTLGYATYNSDSPFPSDPDYLSRSIEMVKTDTEFLIKEYEKILFKENTLSSDYPIVHEIEIQLSFLKGRETPVAGVEKLLKRIRNDKGDYRLYSLLAGNVTRLRRDGDWEKSQSEREGDIKSIIESINSENVLTWYSRIDAVARFKDSIEDWLLNSLRSFLMRLAEEKPELARIFADEALKKREGLYFFLQSLMWGLRKSSLESWDRYVNFISEHKLADQIIGLTMSFQANGLTQDLAHIREQDIELILDIANKAGRFSFLLTQPTDKPMEYQVFQTLSFLSEADPRIRKALIKKFIEFPEMNPYFMDRMSFAFHAKWIELKNWDAEDMEILATHLVETERLEYDALNVLFQIGINDFELMMSIFERRIKHPCVGNYHAIPSHFDPEITTLIREKARAKEIVAAWLADTVPEKDYMQSYHLGEFMDKVGGETFREVLIKLVATGTKENIFKVIETMPSSEPADLTLCLAIVKATDDEDILSSIESRMRFAGGGAGSYGENIFGRELRRVESEIQGLKLGSSEPKVVKFCERVLTNLAEDIRRSDEDHQKRMQEDQDDFNAEHTEI
jgi:hypothetical protein